MARVRFILLACTSLALGVSMASAQQDAPIRHFGADAKAFKHAKPVTGLAVIDDGKTIVSADRTALVYWDRAGQREIRRFEIDTENTWFGRLEVSRDQKTLVNIMEGPGPGITLQVRNTDGSIRRSLESTDGRGSLLALTPDGKRVATVGVSGPFPRHTYFIELWDVESGKRVRTIDLKDHSKTPPVLAFSPDGNSLATGGAPPYFNQANVPDSTIHLWNVETGKLIKKLAGHSVGPALGIYQLRFSDDGKYLASAGSHETIVWNVTTGKSLHILGIHWCVRFAPNSSLLVGGRYAPTVLDAVTGRTVTSFPMASGWINHCVFTPDAKTVITGDNEGLIRLWDVEPGKEIQQINGHHFGILEVAFSPDGSRILSGSSDPRICMWNVADGKRLRTIDVEGSQNSPVGVVALRFAADGRSLVASDESGKVTFWSSATGLRVHEIPDTSRDLISSDVDPAGKWLVAGTRDGALRLWNLQTREKVGVVWPHVNGEHGDFMAHGIALSPDGKQLASVHAESRIESDTRIHLWDVQTGKHVRQLGPFDDTQTYRGRRLHFAADGTLYCMHTNGVTQWNSKTGREIRTYPVEVRTARKVSSFALSADGQFLAINVKKEIQIYETPTGGHVHTIPRVSSAMAFSPDGRTLLVGAQDGSVTLWRVNPRGKPVEMRELDKLWLDLGNKDARLVYHALWRLIDNPDQTLPLLAERLTPAKLTDLDLRRHRAIQLLERIHTPAAHKLLEKMAKGLANTPITQHAVAELARWQIRGEPQAIEVLSDERVAQMRQHLPGTRAPVLLAKNGTSLALSPDGRWLACVTDRDTVRIYDIATGKPHGTLTSAGKVAAISFSPDNKRLVCAGTEVRVWHFLTEKEPQEFKNTQEKTLCVACSADGKWVATGTKAGTLMIWSSSGALQQNTKAEVDAVTAVVFTPDSQAVLVAGMEKTMIDFDGVLKFQQSAPIQQWSVTTGKLVHKLDLLSTHLAFSADQRTLVVSGCVRRFINDPFTRGLMILGASNGFVSLDGTTFTDAIVVNHWDWQRSRLIRKTSAKGCINAVSSDGRWMLSGGEDSSIDPIIEWNTNTTGGGGAHGNHESRLHLWEALTGKEVLRGPSKYPSAVAISADGRALAWIDGLANVQLWDLSPIKQAAAAPPIEPLWNDLADADAERAYQAQWIMRSHPKESLAWLKTHLKPSPKDQDERVAALVNQLRSDNFKTRDAATRDLEKFRSMIEGVIEDALPKEPALEARRRIQALLDAYRAEPIAPEELRQVRAIQLLQWLGDGESRALLKALADGSVFTRQTREARTAVEQFTK